MTDKTTIRVSGTSTTARYFQTLDSYETSAIVTPDSTWIKGDVNTIFFGLCFDATEETSVDSQIVVERDGRYYTAMDSVWSLEENTCSSAGLLKMCSICDNRSDSVCYLDCVKLDHFNSERTYQMGVSESDGFLVGSCLPERYIDPAQLFVLSNRPSQLRVCEDCFSELASIRSYILDAHSDVVISTSI